MASGRYGNLGSSVKELDSAWTDRLTDAEHLRAAGRYATAITYGLYALEILLKVRICRHLDLSGLPKAFEIHDFGDLLILSGLSKQMRTKKAKFVRQHWASIQRTSSQLISLRYQAGSAKSIEEADEFFNQLINPVDGLIPWISTQL